MNGKEKSPNSQLLKSVSLRRIVIAQIAVLVVLGISLVGFLAATAAQSSAVKIKEQVQEQPNVQLLTPTPVYSPAPTTVDDSSEADSNNPGTNSIGGPPPGMVRCMNAFVQAQEASRQQLANLNATKASLENQRATLGAEWMATGLASVGNGLPTPEYQARFDAIDAEYTQVLGYIYGAERALSSMQPKDFNCE